MSNKQPNVSIRRIDASQPEANVQIEQLALKRASELANLTADLKHAGFLLHTGSQVFKYQTDTAKVELCAKSIVATRHGERIEFKTLDVISSPLKVAKRKREEALTDDCKPDSTS